MCMYRYNDARTLNELRIYHRKRGSDPTETEEYRQGHLRELAAIERELRDRDKALDRAAFTLLTGIALVLTAGVAAIIAGVL